MRDYGRFGLFLLDGGVAAGDSILPAGWIEEATTPKVLRGGTRLPYGYLWWTGPDGTFAAEGIYGQFLYVNRATGLVIVVLSARSNPADPGVIDDWRFFEAVTDARTRLQR